MSDLLVTQNIYLLPYSNCSFFILGLITTDQMVFPDSNEDERASLITSMQIRVMEEDIKIVNYKWINNCFLCHFISAPCLLRRLPIRIVVRLKFFDILMELWDIDMSIAILQRRNRPLCLQSAADLILRKVLHIRTGQLSDRRVLISMEEVSEVNIRVFYLFTIIKKIYLKVKLIHNCSIM